VKKIIITSILILFYGCAAHKVSDRSPSSAISNNACTEGIKAFFDENAKKEIGLLSEARLVDQGLLRDTDVQAIKNDPVYKHILLSEDEHLRDDTAKIIGLIRKYRPEMQPSKVADFYHELFHSCKL